MIERVGHHIYNLALKDGENTIRLARFDDFIWVWKHKMLPLMAAFRDTSSLRQEMVRWEYADAVIRQREVAAELDAERRQLTAAVDRAREILLDQICEQRIVVETNPASNLRVARASRLGGSPAVGLLKQMQTRGLLACINTALSR
jgi:hypothetical protein